MHSNKPYETKSSTFQKKRFEKLCAASQLVCTCAFRRVVATKRHCTQEVEQCETVHLSSHTNKCTNIIYHLKSVLILDIKTLYSLIAPACFDTTHVIIREHSFEDSSIITHQQMHQYYLPFKIGFNP
jgi:hypothetical protein